MKFHPQFHYNLKSYTKWSKNMSGNKLSSKIVGEEFLVLHEFAKKAKENLSKESWDYLIGAAETETTFKRNRFALDSLAFRPRVLRDVENIDLTTELFNHKLRIPLILAPIGSMQDFVDGAGVAPTIAAADFGIMHMTSSTCLVDLKKLQKVLIIQNYFNYILEEIMIG